MAEDSPVPATTPPIPRRWVVGGLVVALLLVAAGWYAGGGGGTVGEPDQGSDGRARLPRRGEPAPDFAVPLTDGRTVRLSDFRGQPVWLNFWGSWCPPCRRELPAMEAAYRRLAPRGLVLLAVAVDESAAEADRYAKDHGASYLIASDPTRAVTGGGYPITNFPTHVLIDADGTVRDVVLAELDEAAFVERAGQIVAPREAA